MRVRASVSSVVPQETPRAPVRPRAPKGYASVDVLERKAPATGEKLTLRQASRGFVAGVGKAFTSIIKAFRARPVRSTVVVGVNVAAMAFVPYVAKAFGVAALGYAIYKVARGAVLAIKHARAGDAQSAEHAVSDIGHGLTDIALKRIGGPIATTAQLPAKVQALSKKRAREA